MYPHNLWIWLKIKLFSDLQLRELNIFKQGSTNNLKPIHSKILFNKKTGEKFNNLILGLKDHTMLH
jgi:hypothetical protein